MKRAVCFLVASASLLLVGCTSFSECSANSDCFRGETCTAGECVPALALDDACNPATCDGEFVAETTCHSGTCEVVACDEKATFCDSGCCLREAAESRAFSDNNPFTYTLDIELDRLGNPHIFYYDANDGLAHHLRWTGAEWEDSIISVYPESIGFFDVAIDSEDRMWMAYNAVDGLYVTQIGPQRIDPPQLVFALPDPGLLDSNEYRFHHPSIQVGDSLAVCAIYGTLEQVFGGEEDPDLPYLFVASTDRDGEWHGGRAEALSRVAGRCSIDFQDGGVGIATSVLRDDRNFGLRYNFATNPRELANFPTVTNEITGNVGSANALLFDSAGRTNVVVDSFSVDGQTVSTFLNHVVSDRVDTPNWRTVNAYASQYPEAIANGYLFERDGNLESTFMSLNLDSDEIRFLRTSFDGTTWQPPVQVEPMNSAGTFDTRLGPSGRWHTITLTDAETGLLYVVD